VKPVYFIPVLFFLIFNCRKDQEIITGDITGKINSYDQYGFLVPSQSGVTVKLFRDTALLEHTLTDSRGQYAFENQTYGKYRISIEKDQFIQTRDPHIIYHAGGYSPTFVNSYLFEVPTYELLLDSIGYYAEDYRIIIHLKFNGDTALPGYVYGFPIRVFAGNSPEVSRENYVSAGKVSLSEYDPGDWQTKVAVYGSLYDYEMDQNFDKLKDGIIYFRLYPIAVGQGYMINDYFPEALGPPSNVISFVWDEVVTNR
jgi:hypothetical protein